MRQVFVIHGGTAFATYEAYLDYLKSFVMDIDRLRGKRDWKSRIDESLGAGYEVFSPSMPSSRNAKYLEWKIWLEKMTPFMQDEVILVGHSLGAVFLAKYLSENNFPKKIKATLLVAPPYNFDEGRPLPEFGIRNSLEKLVKQGGTVFIYHSKDDLIVPFSEFEKYQTQLPKVQTRIFEDRGHFNTETFPELVADIKNLNG